MIGILFLGFLAGAAGAAGALAAGAGAAFALLGYAGGGMLGTLAGAALMLRGAAPLRRPSSESRLEAQLGPQPER